MPREVPAVAWKEDKIAFSNTEVPIYLPDSITVEQLEHTWVFKDWKKTLQDNLALQNARDHAFHEHPYSLRSIEIKSVTKFPSGGLGFITVDAAVERDSFPDDDTRRIPKALPGTAVLRGGSVAVLMILKPKDSGDERYVILTEQPRLGVGSLQFLEIPAGMFDATTYLGGAAAREIKERTGFEIPIDEVIDMTGLAFGSSDHSESSLPWGIYPNAGACYEHIMLCLWEKELDRQEIEDLRWSLSGKRVADEMITLHVMEYEALWRVAARDAKTLAASALYERLSRSGELQKHRKWKRGEQGPRGPSI